MNINIKINPYIRWGLICIIALALLLYSPIQLYHPEGYPSVVKVLKVDTVFKYPHIKGQAKVETTYIDTSREVLMDILIDTTLLGMGDTFRLFMNVPSMDYIIDYKAPIINTTMLQNVIKRDLKEYTLLSGVSCCIGISIPYIVSNWQTIFGIMNALF